MSVAEHSLMSCDCHMLTGWRRVQHWEGTAASEWEEKSGDVLWEKREATWAPKKDVSSLLVRLCQYYLSCTWVYMYWKLSSSWQCWYFSIIAYLIHANVSVNWAVSYCIAYGNLRKRFFWLVVAVVGWKHVNGERKWWMFTWHCLAHLHHTQPTLKSSEPSQTDCSQIKRWSCQDNRWRGERSDRWNHQGYGTLQESDARSHHTGTCR